MTLQWNIVVCRKMAEDSRVSASTSLIKNLNRKRKRKINLEKWKDVSRKRTRDSGEAYISRKGRHVSGKIPPENDRVCNSETCKKVGCEFLKQPQKIDLYKKYYKLSYDDQSLVLMKSIHIKEPSRRKPGKTDANSRRLCTFSYTLLDKEICQKTLLHTYSITQRRIQTLQKKIKEGKLLKDGRGKHNNRPHSINNELKNKIKKHIDSFPRQPSHYSRSKTKCEYFSPDLNLNRMCSLFNCKFPDTAVNRTLYSVVFKENFPNLKFGIPRSDTCKTCDLLYNKLLSANGEAEREAVQLESDLHHSKADQAYKILKKDTKAAGQNPNVVVLCVDLQQVLFCPTLSHSSIFYQRQLSCYNFGIHNMGSGSVTMNLWNETEGKRGSAEIVSLILKYVVDNYSLLLPGEERKLVVWSDRCVGQNNNWRVITLYMYLVHCGYFSDIQQKFLCSGHSFLPCDRDFALIEKRKKVSAVMVPSEWRHVIGEASINKPFIINLVQQEDFKDFDLFKQHLKKTEVKITHVMWIKYSNDDPRAINVRESHNTLRPWRRYEVFQNNRGRPKLFPNIKPNDLPHLYNGLLPITKEKKANLMDMVRYLRNAEHRLFYENIPYTDR